ncbi:MAG TPA: glutamine--fructose-6-phosphate transaminase (isomerizing) [Candidatus Dormibacteraeota bacterium]|jgi:glucosamine--fructose-6-phosphate aminotransferase (isomerizing)|nr:glutamine--fructose-6-phosphate transaminase (isomerizing) [Candidatus Dormibacteraeota bacterium]
MCGIIGYLGVGQAAPVIMEGLKRLEYRGYDSAGVAVLPGPGSEVAVTKSEAKVDRLLEMLRLDMPEGRLGIGHTRWATHGRPTVVNAHPHQDCRGRLSVVHNGIIENFTELRRELEAKGHVFQSDTDSEVVPHLVEEYYHGDLLQAVREALSRLRGAYALALFSADDPELLIGARLNAPLVVGLGHQESFLASDITAILPYTNRVLVLGEGELCAITPLGPTVTTLDGHAVRPRTVHVDWDVSQAEKSGYPHFMIKEIHETPDAVANALRGRLDAEGRVELAELGSEREELARRDEVLLLGMGTSLHAAMLGEHVLEEWAGIRARAQDPSEFRYRRPTAGPDTLVAAVTQSGETADTIVGLRQAIAAGARTVAVTNVVASTAALEADGAIYLQAGPEVSVCSTKTFCSHVISLYLLALGLADARGHLEPERREAISRSLHALPGQLRRVLEDEPRIAGLAHRYSGYRSFMYTGRGMGYPVALEGALKLKEISYVHAEGSSGGALKHGPIALLDQNFPVVAVCTEGPTREKMQSNVHEMVARQAPVLAVVSEGDHSLDGIATHLLAVPRADEAASAVLVSTALQLFAYHLAVELGRDVDQPRNLAKSVTVE